MNSMSKDIHSTTTMILTPQVLNEIRQTVGSRPAECGGILGADDTGIITHYYFDKTGMSSENSYEPDVDAVNAILTNDWQPNGIRMVGIVHSHTFGRNIPSCGDIHYGMQILQALNGLNQFYLPIVTQTDNGMEFHAYTVAKDSELGYLCKKTTWKVKNMEE